MATGSCCFTSVPANSPPLLTPLHHQPHLQLCLSLTPAVPESFCVLFLNAGYLITTAKIPVIRVFRSVTKAPFCHSGELPQRQPQPCAPWRGAPGLLSRTMAHSSVLPKARQERSTGDTGRSGSRQLVWKVLFKLNKLQLYCLNSNPFVSLCFLQVFEFQWGKVIF